MHPSAYAWAASVLTEADVKGADVAEAGALNVNGSVREHAEALKPKSYTGTDLQEGPGVDLVCDAEKLHLKLPGSGVVISTEMLEHAPDWQAAVAGLIRAVALSGVLVLTTRSEGFPYHGYPADHWRFSVEAMGQIMDAAGMDVLDLRTDPDPMSPGVFCKARKPEGWKWPRNARKDWDAISGVTAMAQPG